MAQYFAIITLTSSCYRSEKYAAIRKPESKEDYASGMNKCILWYSTISLKTIEFRGIPHDKLIYVQALLLECKDVSYSPEPRNFNFLYGIYPIGR